MRARGLSGVVACSELCHTYTLKLQLQEPEPRLLLSVRGSGYVGSICLHWGKNKGKGKRREALGLPGSAHDGASLASRQKEPVC